METVTKLVTCIVILNVLMTMIPGSVLVSLRNLKPVIINFITQPKELKKKIIYLLRPLTG